ncbi:hypothetical protein E2C01_007514 [Portunus trituberculatus]|uniref:Uncharacterized protein n=1 Tax=Portunus trituberculatus TaxID=210409 RepID=A0A5B7CYD6_PORTR|nr:hypothetical protein [Portunus trituberculatus]
MTDQPSTRRAKAQLCITHNNECEVSGSTLKLAHK